jgi:probable selenium-dependent hydroxylase accessory protein YqeC
MDFLEGLRINPSTGEMITIIGSGGKTSTMFRIARELSAVKGRAFIGTTTRIHVPSFNDIDTKVYDAALKNLIIKAKEHKDGGIILIGGGEERDKVIGLTPEVFDGFKGSFRTDYIIVEGDGSKGKPIKGTAPYEPIIPRKTNRVILVVGSWGLYKELGEEYFHRREIIERLTGKRDGDIMTPKDVLDILFHREGVISKLNPKMRIGLYVTLKNRESIEDGMELIDLAGRRGFFKFIALGNVNHPNPYTYLWRDKNW